MAQQSNALTYIMLAIFMLLAGMLGAVAAIRHSTATKVETELAKVKSDQQDASAALRKAQADVTTLLELVGHEGGDVGSPGDQNPNTASGSITQMIQSPRISDGTAAASNLSNALGKVVTERDIQATAATSSKQELQRSNQTLNDMISSKDAELQAKDAALEQKSRELLDQAAAFEEKISNINEAYETLQAEREQVQRDLTELEDRTRNQISILQQDNQEKRQALLKLRSDLFRKEDPSFATADGLISSVDQRQLLAYLNLGYVDRLREGTTFSVYVPDNAGIGRRNTNDIKGKLEVVEIMGPHLSKARITYQDRGRPAAKGDPIYSPIFTAGIPMQVAIAGLIDFNGTPGSDREELLTLIRGNGAHVSVQVSDSGTFITQDGEQMGQQEAVDSVNAKTRFLILGDLGLDRDVNSKDAGRQETYNEIRKATGALQTAAENNGVFEIGLSTFLEFLGYSRKNEVFRTSQTYPRPLANGARSQSVNSTFGNRDSGSAIGGKFAKRRPARLPSLGHVSKLYE